ncbi:MAG TPA: FkbM family methyltransferase [Polyangia bacterium]|nr:FkbM family methyltransferase [Polyangia bacterium]
MRVARLMKDVAKRWVRPAVIQYAEHDFVATTRIGAVLAGNTLDLIQRYVFAFGGWEPNLSRYIADRLRPGDVFVDVGANTGYFSLLASPIVGPSGKVLALEASPAIHGLLLDNLRRNRADNVEALNVAVADRPLDALLTPGLIQKVRLVKIDAEGAEWPVIRGMREALRRAPDDLEVVVELSPRTLGAQGTTAEEVLSVFAEARFHPYRLEADDAAGSDREAADPRPRRLTTPISVETGLVLSRRDAAFL